MVEQADWASLRDSEVSQVAVPVDSPVVDSSLLLLMMMLMLSKTKRGCLLLLPQVSAGAGQRSKNQQRRRRRWAVKRERSLRPTNPVLALRGLLLASGCAQASIVSLHRADGDRDRQHTPPAVRELP